MLLAMTFALSLRTHTVIANAVKQSHHCEPSVKPGDSENIEGNAAKFYFQKYHPGLVRSNDDPVNSCLNYGFAILRNTIIRDVVCAGFYPTLEIHHIGPFNSFNLADDLIEPWRAMVD